MAKVDTSLTVIYDWKDGDTMKSADYERERDVIIKAINSTDDEVQANQNFLIITQLMGVF